MSTLKVTALKNPSSSANNIVLNTDGTVVIPSYTSNNYITDSYTSNNYITERYVGGTNDTKTNTYSNFDNIYGSQFFDGASATGAPDTGWFWGIHHEHANQNGYGFQLAVQNAATPDVYIRTQSANSWNSWQTLGGSSGSSFTGAAGVFSNFSGNSGLALRNNFSTASYNVGGFTVSSSGITVPSDGYYDCFVNLYMTASSARTNIGLRFYINTTAQAPISASDYIRSASGHNEASTNLRMILYMTAGQQFRMGTQQLAAAGTVTITGANSNWIIQKVG